MGSAIAQAVMPANKTYLLERFVEDYGYQSCVRNVINDEIKKQGIPQVNLGDKYFDVEATVSREMSVWTKEFFKKLNINCTDQNIALPWP